jgi:hypothetical protein
MVLRRARGVRGPKSARISSSTGGSTITYQLSLRIEYVKASVFLSPHRVPICAAFKWSTLNNA